MRLGRPQTNPGLAFVLLLASAWGGSARAEVPGDSAAIVALVMGVPYGVPDSPAFELLPEKPDQVTHATTPNDFQAGLMSWVADSRIRVGFAADTRPFLRAAGSPRQYRASALRQIALRTVLGAGSSAATSGSKDVVTALGIRFPLLDRGDSRANAEYAQRLVQAINDAMSGQQPGLDETLAQTQARLDKASQSAAVEEIRRNFSASHWNAPRIELGAAGSITAIRGEVGPAGTRGRQGGVWLALSGPWWRNSRRGQVNLVGKSMWTRASADSQETNRLLVGARLRGFWSGSFALSFEAAHSWSRHSRAPARDEEWDHYAAVLEWFVPHLNGWVGVAYGGDTAHEGQKEDQLSLRYALYRKAILSR